MKRKDTLMPTFDFREKRRVVSKTVKSSSSGVVSILISSFFFFFFQVVIVMHYLSVGSCYFLCLLQVIVDGTYALHSKLRSLLDIRVAVVTL